MTAAEQAVEGYLVRVKMGLSNGQSKLMWVLDRTRKGFRFISSPYGSPTFKEAKKFYLDSITSERVTQLRQINSYMRQVESFTRNAEEAKQVAIPGEQP